MTSPLTDAEIEALLDGGEGPPSRSSDVRARDFARPRRFGDERIDELSRAVRRALPDFSARLALRVRGEHRATLAALVEERADELIGRAALIVPAILFDCGAEAGFALWDAQAVVAACELALGAADGAEPSERRLTSIEESILIEVAKPLVVCVTTALGMEAKNVRLARDRDAFPRFDADGADPSRLGAQIALDGSTGGSMLRIYVPVSRLDAGAPTTRPAARTHASAPPAHLRSVSIDVAACIGSIELPLHDLLALEIGDVLTLPTRVGGLATLVADGREIATARFGETDGRLALRIDTPARFAAAPGRSST